MSLSRDDCNADAEADVEAIIVLAAGNLKCVDTVWLCNSMWDNIGHRNERTIVQKGVIYFLTTGYDKQYARCTRATYL